MSIRARVSIAAAVLVLLAAGIAIAKTTVRPFVLTETVNRTTVEGEWNFLPSGNITVRNRVSEYNDVASDPRLSGTVVATTNANLDPDWTGPAWGAYHSEIGSGAWNGVWHGNFNMATGSGDYDAVGYGSGSFKGLQVMEHCVYVNLVGSCTGRILDTNAK